MGAMSSTSNHTESNGSTKAGANWNRRKLRQRPKEPKARSKLAKESCRTFRQMVLGWSLRNLHCLVVEFEASLALREITASADLARPRAPSLQADLARLYRKGVVADTLLLVDDQLLNVHRCILSCRSAWLQSFLRTNADNSSCPVRLNLPGSPISSVALDAFIFFLYTGVVDRERLSAAEYEQFCFLNSTLDVSDDWLADVTSLLYESNDDADIEIVFTRSTRCVSCENINANDGISKYASLRHSRASRKALRQKYLCHSAILATRSPFFHSLIVKRRVDSCTNSGRVRIFLDESVIPRQYAPVIFDAFYSDRVDLSIIERGHLPSASSLSEVKAIASGKCLASPLEEATELYQIGRFLDFPVLVQGCEDILASRLDYDTLHALYSWASEPHGSPYVRRCCVAFLAEHFSHVANSPDLFNLDETLLIETLKLDFVQASELEILVAILKWGEHQLIRTMEEREPNLIAGTMHSISRKGFKRSAESDAELRHVLANLLPLVRFDYVLPRNHMLFLSALQRNLLDIDCGQKQEEQVESSLADGGGGSTAYHRLWSSSGNVITQPRLFMPFYVLTKKALVKKVLSSPEEVVSLIDHRPPPYDISADTVDLLKPCSPYSTYQRGLQGESELSIVDGETIERIHAEVANILRDDPLVYRAMNCGCSYHRRAVLHLVQMKVIREYGLEDVASEIMQCRERWPSPLSRSPNVVDNRNCSHLQRETNLCVPPLTSVDDVGKFRNQQSCSRWFLPDLMPSVHANSASDNEAVHSLSYKATCSIDSP
uniref:BTB domain-containing protein n=1 Tax=Trichuris muris TaxID=70415 RepID=A0A5S6QYA5_TRIMR